MRKSWDTYFMDLAKMAATRATCPKRHVGAILVDRHNYVISTGYNGSKPGAPHCDDKGCIEVSGHCIRTIHAEINAINRANRWKKRGSKLYTTDFPCFRCAKAITKAGIVEIVYEKPYPATEKEVLALFRQEGIVIRSILDSLEAKRRPVKAYSQVRTLVQKLGR